METTLVIKNILLPKLEKDSKFSEGKVDATFWEKFATDLLHFEEDAKPLYANIYSLGLDNPEKLMDKLPNIYAQFLKELAESYVLGKPSQATDYLLKNNNTTFAKEINFLKTMQQAIKSVERKRIKTDLPKSYERLTFELSVVDLANITKKKGREDLKEKMKQWDAELEEQESVSIVASSYTGYHNTMPTDVKKTKVISLSWMKYAIAACLVLATGIFFFRNTNQVVVPTQNTVVTTDTKKDSAHPQKNIPVKEAIILAEIETVSKKITVQESESMGFSGAKKHKITINYKDASKRIASLEKVIVLSKTIDSKILSQYKAELASLKTQKNKYVFDGKELTLFMKNDKTAHSLLLTEDQTYFLKKGNVFYDLKISKVFLPLEKVSDAATIETLEKIHFENQ